jgi:hypothetical protein
MKSALSAIGVFSWAIATLMPTGPSQAEESCGLVSKQSREFVEQRRFEILAEHSGRAFIDMRTCLVWQLNVWDKPSLTLNEAMGVCASYGQGGPFGEMGWQIPSLSELTSLDSEDWNKQSEEFKQYNIHPLARSEIEFWTSTSWLGKPDSLAVVQFSVRTTVVRPVAQDGKAAVWCVRGYPARGLR